MWNVNEAKQAARTLATALALASEEQAAAIVRDYQAALDPLPSITRAAFINELVANAPPAVIERFFRYYLPEERDG
jgi:hypothetical protein